MKIKLEIDLTPDDLEYIESLPREIDGDYDGPNSGSLYTWINGLIETELHSTIVEKLEAHWRKMNSPLGKLAQVAE